MSLLCAPASRVRSLWVLLLAVSAFASPAASTHANAATDRVVAQILVFGDSISAGFGIRVEQGWVALLARKIEQAGYGFHVVNASISGETTAGGLARLSRALDLQQPQLLILELGGNDGLRGLPLTDTRTNLAQMIQLAQQRRIAVLLLGMRLPPNYGARYTNDFQAMYTALAQQYHTALVPFLLEKVALNPALMQADGLHPNESGQPLLLDTVWPTLEPLLQLARTRATATTGGKTHP